MVLPLKIGPLSIERPVCQAPMAGFTDFAFREIVRRFGGAGLLTTEMVSARGFRQIETRRDDLPERLWGVADEPRPLAVQIWDNDSGLLAYVGRRLAHELRVSVVDINFGCPVKAVSQSAQSGSYLLRYPDRIAEIVARVAEACAPVPVTAKIRLGGSRESINAIEVSQAIEEAGGAAVTVHGRTAADRFRGSADWDQIARIKPHLKRIPLVGNGDLRTAEDVVEAFRRWEVDGVMIGRAALTKPWLFGQVRAALAGEPIPPEPTLAQQRELLLDHYGMIVDRFGPTRGTIQMRRHACHYAQGQHGSRTFRNQIGKAATPQQFSEVVDRYFPRQ